MSRPLSLTSINQSGDDVECCHQNNQRQDDKHHVAFHVHGVEKGRVRLPVVIDKGAVARTFYRRADKLARIVQIGVVAQRNVNAGNAVAERKEFLRRRQRHKDKIGVIFVHSEVERSGHAVALHPRHRAEHGDFPVRGRAG